MKALQNRLPHQTRLPDHSAVVGSTQPFTSEWSGVLSALVFLMA